MKDGLWRIDAWGKCGGFVISGGRVVACAPVFCRKFSYWVRFAEWLEE